MADADGRDVEFENTTRASWVSGDPARLLEALRYAVLIIEGYESEIRNGWRGADLAGTGFCQGRIYDGAVGDILRRAGIAREAFLEVTI